MSSFEWMELQTLTNDIDMSRSRLIEARKSGDQGRVGALEEEITRAEKRRVQLLAHISTNIVTAPEPAKAKEGAGSGQASDAVAEAPQDRATGEQPPGETAGAPEPAPRPKAREGAPSRHASAHAAEAVHDEAKGRSPPGDTAGAAEPASPPKAREDSGPRHASAHAAEAVRDEAKGRPPSGDTASAAEPAPPPKAGEESGSRQAPAPAAEAVQDEARGQQPSGDTASAAEPAPPPEAREDAGSRQASAPAAEALRDEANSEQPLPDRVDRIVASGADSPASASKADSVEGGTTVWDQLKPSDIERVKNELGTRRAEMLARHAEELKGLDAEQSQLETLEQAIDMFLRKANRPEGAAA